MQSHIHTHIHTLQYSQYPPQVFIHHDVDHPLVLRLGQTYHHRRLVKGVDISLRGMCVGDMRVLRVPAFLAYGGAEHKHPAIPANSDVFFQVCIMYY